MKKVNLYEVSSVLVFSEQEDVSVVCLGLEVLFLCISGISYSAAVIYISKQEASNHSHTNKRQKVQRIKYRVLYKILDG